MLVSRPFEHARPTRPGARSPSRQRGLTFPELVVALAIFAILTAIAIPSLQGFLQETRLSTASNDLTSTIFLARSEAVKRNQRVGLCRSADPLASMPTCTSGAGSWADGWLVFEDANRNNVYDAGTDTLLRQREGLRNVVLTGTSSCVDDTLVFDPQGRETTCGAAGGTIVVCDARLTSSSGARGWREIVVSNTGRPRTDCPVFGTPSANLGCDGSAPANPGGC